MKFAIHTFGCKVNIYESEYIINLLQDKNYQLVDFDKEADIYIINTCTVTNEADKKDRKLINITRKNHPNSILIVIGCYSQLNPQSIEADIILLIQDRFNSNYIKYQENCPEFIKKALVRTCVYFTVVVSVFSLVLLFMYSSGDTALALEPLRVILFIPFIFINIICYSIYCFSEFQSHI